MTEKTRGVYFILILLIPIAFFWPNLRSGGVMLPLDLLYHLQPFSQSVPPALEKIHNSSLSDLVTLYYPSMELARSSGRAVPLWNPYSFLGAPALANAQNGVLFPLSWLFRFLPAGPAYLAIALGKMWFCGFFAFLFFRKVGFQSQSALLGAIAFMLCGHMITWFGYPTSFPLCVWPFLMWAVERVLESACRRNTAWLALAFGLLFIGGQPQTGFLITAAAGLYLVIRCAQHGKPYYRIWIAFAVSTLLGLCLAAPQILPFLEYLRLSAASAMRGSYGHYGWKYYPWFTLTSWIMPKFFGDVRNANFWGFSSFLGEAIYIGAVPMILATLGVFSSKKNGNYFKAILAVFLLGCFGLYLKPMARLYLALPLLSDVDNNKLVALVAFGLISFAVMGLELLLTEAAYLRRILVRYSWIAVAWTAFAGFGVYYFRDALRALNLSALEMREAGWLAAFLITGWIVLWLLKSGRLSRRTAASLILLATVGDLFRVWIYYFPSYPETYLAPKSDALAFLQQNAGSNRIMGLGDMLPPEISTLFHLQDMRGYDGMTPFLYYRVVDKIDPSLHDLWRKLHWSRPPAGKWTPSTLFFRSLEAYLDSTDPKVIADLSRIDYWSNNISSIQRPSLLSMFGVRFILSPKGTAIPEGTDFQLMHSADADVWENSKALPRAFIVTAPILVDDDEAALKLISDRNFPFERTAVVAVNRDASTVRVGMHSAKSVLLPADIQQYGTEKVRIRADSPEGGWLILSDLYYPGWKATCDGSPARIFPGNYLCRAVQVPAGSHIVEFAYQPASFRFGCLLALLAGLCVVILLAGKKHAS